MQLPFDTVRGLAERLGWSLTTVRHRLCILRKQGLGAAVTLWSPEQAGRPLHVVARVRLARLDIEAITTFETACRADPAVSHAALVTGPCDYVLWSWHGDERAANAWRHALELRPEVARCETHFVRVLFGHTLSGPPIYTR